MLTVIDEFTRRCPAIVVGRKLNSDDVHDCVTHLFVAQGAPENVRSDNGPEFVARNVRAWLGRIGVKMLFIEPGSPWENGYCGVFNSKLRDELLAGELFSTLYIERSRRPYNYHKTASPARLPAAGAGDGLAVSASSRLRFARPVEGLATRDWVLT
jgi:putative transposase